MARSLAVVAFIAAVAAAALFVFERPTVARGSVIAADLMATNQATLVSLDCDPEIPIGISGARFSCRAEFKAGEVKRLEFKMDRAGTIKQIGESSESPRIDKTDPWN